MGKKVPGWCKCQPSHWEMWNLEFTCWNVRNLGSCEIRRLGQRGARTPRLRAINSVRRGRANVAEIVPGKVS